MPTRRASERRLKAALRSDREQIAAMENLEWHHKATNTPEGMLFDAMRHRISLAEEALAPKPPKKR